MSSEAATRGLAADGAEEDKDAHLTTLILQKYEGTKRIAALEAEVAELKKKLDQAAASQAAWGAESTLPQKPAKDKAASQNTRLTEISSWNEELIHTVEKLQNALLRLEADAKSQIITLTDKMTQLNDENERLLNEIDSLKARVGDDVLRQRQTNRIEMAFERARIAARVRAAGLQRLEAAEASLMEAHDDMYHVQRWDAMLLPQRDVSFVFHFVSSVEFPLNGVEEFIVSVYQQFLFHSCSCCHGYRVGFYKGMEVFAFQSPSDALLFTKESHEQLVSLSWPSRAESVPFFSSIVENNTVLFRGPRIHTCIYTCTPESYVDPVSGRYSFFGPEVAEAVRAAIEQAPIGEIAVNDLWAKLVCKQSRFREDSAAPVLGDAADLRNSLGSQWDVVALPGAHNIVASLLPLQLRSRRGIQANVLYPSRKYPCLELKNSDEEARMIVKALKGVLSQTVESPEDAGKGIGGGGLIMQKMRRRANFLQGAVLNGPSQAMDSEKKTEFSESAAQLLELFSLQQEKQNVIALYEKTEKAYAALERDMMESEDRFEISKHKTLDASETAYVCTIDTGDNDIWKRILLKSISDEQFESIRNTIRGHIHNAAKVHYGFLMNGNYADVFTYVFREVEQALAFVSEMYIKVNRTGTKYAHTSLGKGRDIFLFRAGVASGPMSTIYRSLENGVLKCTGPIIRLSGTLCDLAKSGEILAMEDVIRTFYSKNENLLDAQYNIVKQGSQFVGTSDAPAVVHSILPKPFAYRRQQLHISGRGPAQREKLHLPYRSVLATLMLRQDELPRQSVLEMMEQKQRRLEYAEAAMMSAEDDFEHTWEMGSTAAPLLRNPWVLLCQPQAEEQAGNALASRRTLVRFKTTEEVEADLMHATRPIAFLAFLYCDVTNLAAVNRAVPASLAKRVWGHYNYIVQSTLSSFDGFVAKTNSATAYLAVFEDPATALEAARQIQLELVQTSWPSELRPLEATLHVKDTKTNTVLFNGPRAQIAVHVSDQYTWRAAPPAATSAAATASSASGKSLSASGGGDLDSAMAGPSVVHINGVGVDEAFILGRHAHGGEIRLSRPLLEAVGRQPSGKLLLEQLSKEVVVAPSVIRPVEDPAAANHAGPADGAADKADKAKVVKTNMFSEECVASVPKCLEGRLALLLPSISASGASAAARTSGDGGATAAALPLGGGGGGGTSSKAATTTAKEKAKPAHPGEAGDEQALVAVSSMTTGKMEAAGRASLALAKAMPVLSTLSTQNSWLKDPRESANPLPPAVRAAWSSDDEQSSASSAAAKVNEEAKRIHQVMQALLKLFPSAKQQALLQAHDAGLDGSGSELPLGASGTLTLEGESAEDASGSKGEAKATGPSSATRGGTQRRRSSKEDSSAAGGKRSAAATAAAARRTAARAATIRQYFRFMDFSKYIVSMLVNALEIGTEQRVPPPLPLPSSEVTREVSDSNGGANASKEARGSASAIAGRVKSAQNGGVVPLPPVPSPPGRGVAKSPPTTSIAGLQNQLTSGAKTTDAPARKFVVNREQPFQSALDYVDEACRSLTQASGTELGKMTAIPAAPPSKPKAFPNKPPPRRH